MLDQPQTTDLLKAAYAKIDAILRGDHSGWDQAMAKLRNELREAVSTHAE